MKTHVQSDKFVNSDLVTVFGASGFLGRHTVRSLARHGYRIRAVTRKPHLAHNLPPMGHVGQIQLFKADVHDADAVEAALAGAHLAVNLVGTLNSGGNQSFEALHVTAPRFIASAARTAGVRALVHMSALGADQDSNSSYAKSKALGERHILELSTATVLRPSVVFGAEDRFLNRFAGLARSLPALPLIGGGHTRFQPVFVGDVAAAVLAALERPSARQRIFELGGPTTYTFRELMEFILKETDRRRLLVSVPFPLAFVQSFILQFLPRSLLTVDQVRLLRHDNVVGENSLKLSDLGIEPTSLEAEAPSYLWRFRPKGQYEAEARIASKLGERA